MDSSRELPRTGSVGKVSEDRWYADRRVAGLLRFAIAITFLNILGHAWLGFEQSWATPFVALAAAYSTETVLEWLSARQESRRPRYQGEGAVGWIKFLLSAHVSALAVGMLLMPLEQLWVIAFAASAAVASKALFKVRINGRMRHFLNPSNFGITLVLLLFPSVGIAPPYQFSEAVSGAMDWILPLVIICTGSLLNTKMTGRMPLIGAWVAGFVLQAVIRSVLNGTPLFAALVPITGFAFILFSFYMVTDPATTPGSRKGQIWFGFAVAGLYGVLMEAHIVFAMFFALTLVTLSRGAWFALEERWFHQPVKISGPAE